MLGKKNLHYILSPPRIEAGTLRVLLPLCHPPAQILLPTWPTQDPHWEQRTAGGCEGGSWTGDRISIPASVCLCALHSGAEQIFPSLGDCASFSWAKGGSTLTLLEWVRGTWGCGTLGSRWDPVLGGPSCTHLPGGFPSWLQGGDLSPLISDAISGLAEQSWGHVTYGTQSVQRRQRQLWNFREGKGHLAWAGVWGSSALSAPWVGLHMPLSGPERCSAPLLFHLLNLQGIFSHCLPFPSQKASPSAVFFFFFSRFSSQHKPVSNIWLFFQTTFNAAFQEKMSCPCLSADLCRRISLLFSDLGV